MRIKVIGIMVFMLFSLSCKRDEFDAEYYANKYCNCFADYYGQNSRTRTHEICDSAINNKFLNLYKKSFEDDHYNRMNLPKSLGDSIDKFMTVFVSCLDKKCGYCFIDSNRKAKPVF